MATLMIKGRPLSAEAPDKILNKKYLHQDELWSVGGPPYPFVVLYYLHQCEQIRPDFRNFGRKILFLPDSENPDPVHP